MKFKKIYIEITNICNMNCSFCPPTNREKAFMEKDLFQEVIGKIKGFTDYIYLHIKGEPFLHPDILNLIDIANKSNLKVNITSNGTILNYDVLNKNNLRQINFSLHSFEEDDNEKKERYIYDILNFSKKAQENGKIISLRLWNLNNNFFDEKNKLTIKLIEDFFQIKIELDSFIRGKGVKLEDKIYLNFEEVFQWPKLSNEYYNEKGFCYGLKSHLGILVDGTLVPCCLDDEGVINLGNIKEVESLKDIIQREKSQNIINSFNKRLCNEELCKHCEFKERF